MRDYIAKAVKGARTDKRGIWYRQGICYRCGRRGKVAYIGRMVEALADDGVGRRIVYIGDWICSKCKKESRGWKYITKPLEECKWCKKTFKPQYSEKFCSRTCKRTSIKKKAKERRLMLDFVKENEPQIKELMRVGVNVG